MKFLCLAYGSEKDWLALTKQEQKEFLAQDQVLRDRGAFMSAVETSVTTVTAWDGAPFTTNTSFAKATHATGTQQNQTQCRSVKPVRPEVSKGSHRASIPQPEREGALTEQHWNQTPVDLL
jgi:hypothetical protein